MKIELSKDLKKLLKEIPMDYEVKSLIITVDEEANYVTGNHDVLDGNHRLAMLIEEGRISEAQVYTINYNDAEKMGFWENQENQEEFEEWVKVNGKKVINFEVA